MQTYTQVSTAQNQAELGFPRPSAPFEYANAWGNNYSMLLVWFILGGLVFATAQRRLFAVAVIGVSAIPVVYSQNRGMWLGLIIGIVYVGVRLAMRRRFGVLVGLVIGTLMVVGAGRPVAACRPSSPAASPRREATTSAARCRSSRSGSPRLSPIIGFGSTRSTIGSDKSLAIGQSPACPRCGNRVIGSTGQLWLLLVAQGFVGAFLYLFFLGQAVVRYWRDQSPVGHGRHVRPDPGAVLLALLHRGRLAAGDHAAVAGDALAQRAGARRPDQQAPARCTGPELGGAMSAEALLDAARRLWPAPATVHRRP